MASVLVDLDDLSYMDDVDEDLEPSADTTGTNENTPEQTDESKERLKKVKRLKNRPVGEKLRIDSNSKVLTELRKERQEKLKSEKGLIKEIDTVVSVSNDDREALIGPTQQISQDKKSILRELREERRKSQLELEKKRYSLSMAEKTMNGNSTKTLPNKELHVNTVTVELHKVDASEVDGETVLATYKQTKTFEDPTDPPFITDKKTNDEKKPENSFDTNEPGATTDLRGINRGKPQSLSRIKVKSTDYDADVDEEAGADNNDEDEVFDKDSKAMEMSTARKLVTADHSVTCSPKITHPLQPCSKTDTLHTDKDVEKLRQMMSSSSLSTAEGSDISPTTEFKKSNMKSKRPKDIGSFKDVGKGENQERKSKPKIRIVVTNEEGIEEHTELISHSKRDTRKEEISPDTDSSDIVAYNYLKHISTERKRSIVDESKIKKIKPFHSLQKIKRGEFDVGIAGDTKRCNIKAITVMKDKKMVMFDRNNKCLKLFDKDFIPLDRLNIPVKFCSITSIFEETIAVTLPESKKLQLYHIDKNKFEKGRIHPVEAEFYSVAAFKSKVYLLKRNPKPGLTEIDEWQIVSLDFNKNCDSIKTLRTFSPGHQDNTLLANSAGLYMTHKLENEILHLGHDGTFKLRYKIQMSLPMGITSDKFGNIYVCGGSVTSFIEICKFNLNGSRIIYNKTSSDPVAMCFDRQDNNLFVCDKIQGNITKYKIEHTGLIQGLMKSFVMGGNM